MISVLIASFGHPVHDLVNQLVAQAEEAGISYEILVGDDMPGTPIALNLPHPNVRHVVRSQNLGRAGNRNALAREAHYPWLLFLDADASVPPSFIKRYLEEINHQHVVVGGTSYGAEVPPPSHRLRWMYGRAREMRPAQERNLHPYNALSTFNFMAPREVMLQHPLEAPGPYGHEDTLLGLRLKAAGVPLVHIDNPAEHLGLDENGVFLQKTRQALDGHLGLLHQGIRLSSGLERAYLLLKTWPFRPLAAWLEGQMNVRIEKLVAGKGTLRDYDLYRLAYLLREGRAPFPTPSKRT